MAREVGARAGQQGEPDRDQHLARDVQRAPVANSSRVPVTAPSTEFSKGTTAPSAEPSRTAAKASATVSTGMRSASRLCGRLRSAVSAKVPSGPR